MLAESPAVGHRRRRILHVAWLLIGVSAVVAAAVSASGPRQRPDFYVCEGCEAVHEHDLAGLPSTVVIPAPDEPGERLVLTGRVLRPDGKSPARGVVLYLHHTNAQGVYPRRGDERGWGRRHGYLRGWLKTNTGGEYRIETIRPGAYPGRSAPAHVHVTVKEPDRQEYWIDDFVFDDDPLVDGAYRGRRESRGGSGIVTLAKDATGTWVGRRDIVLEP